MWDSNSAAYKLECKKPHFQYNVYQKCSFLYLILECGVLQAEMQASS